jgi:hypothetical protein
MGEMTKHPKRPRDPAQLAKLIVFSTYAENHLVDSQSRNHCRASDLDFAAIA